MINSNWFKENSLLPYCWVAGALWALILFVLTQGKVIMGVMMSWPDPSLFLAMVGMTVLFWVLTSPAMWRMTWFRWVGGAFVILTFFIWVWVAVAMVITLLGALLFGAGRR